MPKELRPIPGYRWLYSITRDGRVFSHGRTVRHNTSRTGFQNLKPKWLKSTLNKNTGYFYIGLYKHRDDRERLHELRNHYIHVLVMMVYGPKKPSKKHQVNHKDLNKSNNSLSNLEWATSQQNINHAIKNGRMSRTVFQPKDPRCVGNTYKKGMRWITNDIINKNLRKNKQPPKGWRFGRLINWNFTRF